MSRQVFNALCTPEARNIVRHVFRHRQDLVALDSHEIFETALKLYPEEPATAPPKVYGEKPMHRSARKGWQLPPQPSNHPIRSMRYLKKIVLEYMAEGGEIEKVVVRRTGTRDEADRYQQVLRSKTSGIVPVPPEKQHPNLLRAKESWLWRYAGSPEQLKKDEPVLKGAVLEANLKKLFRGEDKDPEFHSQLKFVDVRSIQNPPRERKGGGHARGFALRSVESRALS